MIQSPVSGPRSLLVAVTGANGSVGSNLVDELVQHGYSVRGLVRKGADRSLLEGAEGTPNVELRTTNFHDAGCLTEAFLGTSCVYHLAARARDFGSEQDFYRSNVETTVAVTQAALAAGVPRLVFASSAVMYGCSSRRNLRECDTSEDLRFAYSRSKREAENYLLGLGGFDASPSGEGQAAVAQQSIEVVIVRLGDVFGPRDLVTTPALMALIRGGWFPCVGSGQASLCLTYVTNAAQGLRLAGECGKPGEIYNIAAGTPLALREYVGAVAKAMGRRVRFLTVPYFATYPLAGLIETLCRWFRVSDPPLTRYRVMRAARDCHMSIAKAEQELGYRPDLDLAAQIRATVEWHSKRGRG